MVMIILCHFTGFLGISFLSQFFNVGVYIFLLISGWLYSNKEINQPAKWIFGKWLRLCVPIYIWMIMVCIYSAIALRAYPSIKDVLLLLTNTQGIGWVIFAFPQLDVNGVFGGLGSLWFVSVIYLCYLLMLGVKKIERKLNKKLIGVIFIAAFIAFVGLVFLRVNIVYFICFFIGYLIGKSTNKISTRAYIVLTIAMLLGVMLRLVVRSFMDGTLFYGNTVVGISHTLIAVWFCITMKLLVEKSEFIRKIASSKAVLVMDGMSYFIYITHYYFLQSNFRLKDLAPGLGLQTIIFLVLTIVTAIIIKTISGLINGRKV